VLGVRMMLANSRTSAPPPPESASTSTLFSIAFGPSSSTPKLSISDETMKRTTDANCSEVPAVVEETEGVRSRKLIEASSSAGNVEVALYLTA
jgi:hypothetical protein